MNRLVRQLLFMFGPLILRQVTKAWKNKDRKQQWNTPDNQQQQLPKRERARRNRPVEVIEVEPKLSEEEKNFKLEEDDIMLDKDDLKYTKSSKVDQIIEEENLLDTDGDKYFE